MKKKFFNFNFPLCNKQCRIRQSRTSVQGWDTEVRLSFCSTTFIVWVLLSWLECGCSINMMQMQRGQNCGYHSSLLPAPGDLYCHGHNNSTVLSHVPLFTSQWTIACQASLYVEFLQARILQWVAMLPSRRSSLPRDWTQVFHIACRFFTIWATREAQECWSG